MPNWIRNKFILGNKEKLNELFNKYVTKINEEDEEIFDFNKVIKMPEELNIEFSSKSNDSLILYLNYINPNNTYFKNNSSIEEKEFFNIYNKIKDQLFINNSNIILNESEIKKIINKYKDNELDELLLLGKTQVDNLIKYGYMNWYEWRINNWGTKWNSINFKLYEDNKSFSIDTPWDPPIPILIQLSKDNPSIKIAMIYADENIGSNAGYVLISKGKIEYKGKFKDYSVDAYKLAFDVWECKDQYKFNEIKNNYEYIY